MPNDIRDLRVIIDIGEDVLSDYGVLLHLEALFHPERPGLRKEPVRQTNLADVVDKTC